LASSGRQGEEVAPAFFTTVEEVVEGGDDARFEAATDSPYSASPLAVTPH